MTVKPEKGLDALYAVVITEGRSETAERLIV